MDGVRASRALRSRRGDRLERRLRELEDRAHIASLLARYGPAVDALEGSVLPQMWTTSGSYLFDATRLEAAELAGLVDLESHRRLVEAGCGHLLTTPHITLAGATATAVNHSVVLQHEEDGWRAVRLSANRWHLVRTVEGWRVQTRTARLLDGRSVSRDLLVDHPSSP